MNDINEQAAPETDARSAPFQLDRDMAVFVGKNIDYYSRKWVIQNPRTSKRTWNGAAFLLGPVWLVYRKMHWQAAAYIAIALVCSLATSLLSEGINHALSYAFPVAIGMCGNSIYLAHAEKVIKKVSDSPLPADIRDAELVRRGGTNPVAAWLLGIAIIVLTAVAVISA
ncbi:DUF2628 domain-containing protein [Caballeronia sp. GAFFF1]|uniref:DUF2628 domain-containing protein n=1 Tax=Caballeronia sp. GAFFF1 TaxID=2921779 RepID=UPI002028A360|nr:DUF2628 domain-containing protein [Caballeronia sp. GAFFF1]